MRLPDFIIHAILNCFVSEKYTVRHPIKWMMTAPGPSYFVDLPSEAANQTEAADHFAPIVSSMRKAFSAHEDDNIVIEYERNEHHTSAYEGPHNVRLAVKKTLFDSFGLVEIETFLEHLQHRGDAVLAAMVRLQDTYLLNEAGHRPQMQSIKKHIQGVVDFLLAVLSTKYITSNKISFLLGTSKSIANAPNKTSIYKSFVAHELYDKRLLKSIFGFFNYPVSQNITAKQLLETLNLGQHSVNTPHFVTARLNHQVVKRKFINFFLTWLNESRSLFVGR